jgi:hypothetical protein
LPVARTPEKNRNPTHTRTMYKPLYDQLPSSLLAVLIFLAILGAIYFGFRYRHWLLAKRRVEGKENIGAIEGSLLGLMALLMAFTFSIAAEKFDRSRRVLVEEANAISTAILRCDLYPDSIRTLLRADFSQYVDARIAYYDARDNQKLIQESLQKTDYYSARIWKRVAESAQNLQNRARTEVMVTALNNMIDIVTTRESYRIAKVPPIVFWALVLITAMGGFLVGYANRADKENIVLVTAFALMTAMALFLIVELDRPQRGILNIDAVEQFMVQLKSYFVTPK